MRRIIIWLIALSMCAVLSCTKNDDEPANGMYVDLGLTSGTKWKTLNEVNTANAESSYFSYFEAADQFGDKLPTLEQWIELFNECSWTWTGMGCKVVGSNGNSITLPAMGMRHSDNTSELQVGWAGCYWFYTTSIDSLNMPAFHFYENSNPAGVGSSISRLYTSFYRRSVRLVQD